MPTKELSSYLFLGEEDFLKEEAIEKLKSKFLNSSTKDLNYSIFYAKEKDFDIKEMIDVLNTLAFMSEKRLVVLKDADALPEHAKASVLFYLRNPKESSIFVIDTKSSVIKGEFLLELSKLAKLVYNRRLREAEINIWLARKARSSGKKISLDAINLIKDNLPNDLHILSSSMDNLILYTGKRVNITRQDVEKIICIIPLNTGFDLLDALEKKDAGKALMIFGTLQKQKKRETEFLGLLSWQFRTLLRVKELLRIKNKIEISRELGLHSRILDKIVHYASRFRRKEIVILLNEMLLADTDIKTGIVSPHFVLERLILRMCL